MSEIDVYVNVNYDKSAMPAAAPAASQTERDPQRIYSIAELAREFGITARTIRFYEDEGLIAPARRGQTRIFSARDRVRLKLILRGKRLGFSLAEIKELLDLYQVDRTGVQQLRELLRRSRLHIDDLQRRRRDLDAQIQEFRDVESHVAAELRKRGVDPD
jgi:DNA-binding transcriptional MerR regulator